ncbi:MAG TPA: HAMP domain-containing protein [Deltaproteobacteria bacterium]|nr:HAMP domain-containing protein [Deltaproteobacteria bacterium]
MLKTVAARLTLWFAALFALISLTVFVLAYLTLSISLNKRMDEGLEDETMEFEDLYRSNGIEMLKPVLQQEGESEGVESVFYSFLSPSLEILASSDISSWTGVSVDPDILKRLQPGGIVYQTVSVPGREYPVRMAYKKVLGGNIIHIGSTLENDAKLKNIYRKIFGTAFMAMLFCGSLMGWLVSRKAMTAVERVTKTASSIDKGNIAQRVPLGREGKEIHDLAVAFNAMLERIQALVEELNEVTDNIAHDMRSPITRIRGIVETTLSHDPGIDGYREMAGMVVEESYSLAEMINTMLDIAQTDSGVTRLSREEVDMAEIAHDACELFQTVVENKGIDLVEDISQERLLVKGDRSRLQRVLANLLDNAVKHTDPPGKIVLKAFRADGSVQISITDTGTGIEEHDLPHIFERFYRGDKSRSTPGSGLGLALVQSIVRAHKGDTAVLSSPGKGSTFTVIIPSIS